MNISLLAIDIAKNVFQLHGNDERGKAVLKKKPRRGEVLPVLANIPKCIVAMEACGSSNYWAREFEKLGHEVRLVSARFVKAYVKSNKNDANDAEAIAEAASRPSMRFVSAKSIAQQDLQSMHRVRERLVRSRTALSNEIRGLLAEYGIVLKKGICQVRNQLRDELERHQEKLSGRGLEMFAELADELRELDAKIARSDRKIAMTSVCEHPEFKRLSEIPGVGPLTASAVISTVANPRNFRNGRQFAAWVGLVPKQHSTGGRTQLGKIGKRGNSYLRKLLVHGARTTMRYTARKNDRTSQWVEVLKKRVGYNKATVALANKNARIIWALLVHERNYQTPKAA